MSIYIAHRLMRFSVK